MLGRRACVRRRGPKVLTAKVAWKVGRETVWRVSDEWGDIIPEVGGNQ